ncbi:hypothetical protein [Desulfoluna sp.]|uniref:hypothetical protein n=1 Tax=Desulfoluna sp. TaxID=2045199 RepID=UPI00263997AB|nr:hypothetical protein [Desulfoluna sp.]
MKKIGMVLVFFFCSGTAMAALPPQYQNANDLDVMVAYIKAHPEVAARLKSIDLKSYTIHFGEGGSVIFGRKKRVKPFGWVGPAAPLEFKKRTCVGS